MFEPISRGKVSRIVYPQRIPLLGIGNGGRFVLQSLGCSQIARKVAPPTAQAFLTAHGLTTKLVRADADRRRNAAADFTCPPAAKQTVQRINGSPLQLTLQRCHGSTFNGSPETGIGRGFRYLAFRGNPPVRLPNQGKLPCALYRSSTA